LVFKPQNASPFLRSTTPPDLVSLAKRLALPLSRPACRGAREPSVSSELFTGTYLLSFFINIFYAGAWCRSATFISIAYLTKRHTFVTNLARIL
jgi:hypothetical protein